jgi:hypothetical protein
VIELVVYGELGKAKALEQADGIGVTAKLVHRQEV